MCLELMIALDRFVSDLPLLALSSRAHEILKCTK